MHLVEEVFCPRLDGVLSYLGFRQAQTVLREILKTVARRQRPKQFIANAALLCRGHRVAIGIRRIDVRVPFGEDLTANSHLYHSTDVTAVLNVLERIQSACTARMANRQEHFRAQIRRVWMRSVVVGIPMADRNVTESRQGRECKRNTCRHFLFVTSWTIFTLTRWIVYDAARNVIDGGAQPQCCCIRFARSSEVCVAHLRKNRPPVLASSSRAVDGCEREPGA